MHQAGIENVVASSGTSLTVEQIKLIKRFTPNITMLYDGDPAGIKASFRGTNLILEQGMNVKIVLFPEGEDPDSFVRSHRTSEVEAYITDNAVDFISFKAKLLLDETAGDPAAKAGLIKDIVQTISHIPDQIVRTVYIQECSTIMEVPEQTLMNELNKLLRKKFRKKTQTTVQEVPEETTYKEPQQTEFDPLDMSHQEKAVIRLLLLYGDKFFTETFEDDEEPVNYNVAQYVVDDLVNDEIELKDEALKAIFEEFRTALEKNELPKISYLSNHPDESVARVVIELISSPYDLSENWEKNKIYVKTEEDQLKTLTKTTILALKEKYVSRQLKEIEQMLKEGVDETDMGLLLKTYQELKLVHKEINKVLERQILP